MGYDYGIDFRASSGYATDPVNCTYALATDLYTGSVIRGGMTFGALNGWGAQDRDSNNALDGRLAGVWFNQDGTTNDFRLDLPNTNPAVVHLAIGYQFGTFSLQADVRDGNGSLFTVGPTSVASARFMDANGVVHTSGANWVANETGRAVTPTTSYLILRFAASTTSIIAHFRVTESGGGGGGRTTFGRSGLDGHSIEGIKQFNPSLSYHRHPVLSLEAYRREQARKHREFMAKVARRAA